MFAPEMKIEKFEVMDVITVSGEAVDTNPNCPENYDYWVFQPPCA